MAEEKKSAFCKTCDKQVLVIRKGTNHILHLLLTVLTMGFWALIWIGCAVKFGGWRCSQCGSTNIGSLLFNSPTPKQPELKPTELPEGSRKCPFCAELVKIEAKICRYCHKELPFDAAALAAARSRASASIRAIEEAKKPKGICPSCDKVIALDSLQCPNCEALFTPEAAWKIKPI